MISQFIINIQNDDDDVELVNCKYYQIDELHRKIVKNSKFSFLHLNIASLGPHKDGFEDKPMLSILDLNLDILGLTETRLIKDQLPIFKTSIGGYKDSHQHSTQHLSINVNLSITSSG